MKQMLPVVMRRQLGSLNRSTLWPGAPEHQSCDAERAKEWCLRAHSTGSGATEHTRKRMLGHLTVLRSPVPSAFGSPERRGSTDPDPKSVTRESGCPELRVCISITSIICGKCLSPIDPQTLDPQDLQRSLTSFV